MKIGIALSNHYLNKVGGAEIQVKLLIDEFIRNGHVISYITYKKDRSYRGDIPYSLRYINNPPRSIKPLCYIYRKKLFNILDQEKVDVLYQRGNYHFADLISKYGKEKGIPVISALSMLPHAKKKKLKLSKWILFDIIEKYYLIRNYYRFSTKIISQTNEQRNMLLKNFNLMSQVIPNGQVVPIDNFKKDNPKIISWIANIKPWKRPEVFIELAKRNEKKHLKFIMVGRPNNDNNYQHSLNARIKDVKNLEYLGEIPFEATNRLLEKTALFVNTSDLNEGFPNTYIQSWLRRVPVLALDFDPDHILMNEKIGFPCHSLSVMDSKMNYLIHNEKELTEMGNKARKFAVKNFDIRVTADAHLNLFKEVQLKC